MSSALVKVPEAAPVRPGLLLVNLGTPAAPTPAAVKRYLAEFLGDPRLIDYPRALWLLVLHGVILNVRPAKTAHAYASIWRKDTNESPLRYFTRRQAARLAERLGDRMIVDWAMRYGAPSIGERLSAMRAAGATHIRVVALYPQYSATTNASVEDVLSSGPSSPAVLAPAFFDHPAYIEALATEARRSLAALIAPPERILLSFHGLPQRYVDRGDPYYEQCAATSRLLRAAMGWREDFAPMTFQSKFGPGAWLKPATEETLTTLAKDGVKRVGVMTPGFVADCIETLEEISIRARENFIASGGAELIALPCLNDSDAMINLLAALALDGGNRQSAIGNEANSVR